MAGRVRRCWPNDVIRKILARLPFKSLIRFKSLSKQWNLEISGTEFTEFRNQLKGIETCKDFLVETHVRGDFPASSFARLRINLDSLEVSILQIPEIERTFRSSVHTAVCGVEHCRGIYCFFSYNTQTDDCNLEVWNPLTKEYKRVSQPRPVDWWKAFGFGYDSSVDDFKLIYATGYHEYLYDDDLLSYGPEVLCFSLKSDAWSIARIDSHFYFTIIEAMNGVGKHFDGCIYWIAEKYDDQGLEMRTIVCLDLEQEFVSELTCPDGHGELYVDVCKLTVLDGSLCMMINFEDDLTHSDLWIMKEDEMTQTKSWIKLMTIKCNRRRFHCWDFPRLLCLIGEGVLYRDGSLFLYDPKDKSVKPFEVHGHDFTRDLRVLPYMESLVSFL